METLWHNLLSFWTLIYLPFTLFGIAMLFTPMPDKPKINTVMAKSLVIMLVALASLIYFDSWETSATYQARQASQIASEEQARILKATTCSHTEDAAMAWVMAEKAIKPRLKAPASADFQSYSPAHVIMQGCTFTVISYVDAVNSYGAKLRNHFKVIMERNPANGEWTFKEVSL